MNNKQAHLQFIIEHPQDDLARLVYADFLEDNGESEQAEFIRVQIELAKTVNCGHGDTFRGAVLGNCRRCELSEREKELRLYFHLWVPIPGYIWFIEGGKVCVGGTGSRSTDKKPHYSLEFRRGLVEEIADITLEDWIKYGEHCQHHPIQEVLISDKEPLQSHLNPKRFAFFDQKVPIDNLYLREYLTLSQTGYLPTKVHQLLKGEDRSVPLCKWYNSKEAGMKDLSQACIRLFRK